ncbi:scavenger receptor cysteine-rich type 1 protein M130-like [Gymnodraco acuticeps]|uniref:Scavenger receptor cysteine-rich type 1 protein M130-like n=1 Tax=Gymnodraco acuticeps TaxID=8218 RepID=A0A6P8W2P9_GYMAC|nr:scavenger receptor cysteine-rich type 1 protein M130-like [Gymnodraco acuticeps]
MRVSSLPQQCPYRGCEVSQESPGTTSLKGLLLQLQLSLSLWFQQQVLWVPPEQHQDLLDTALIRSAGALRGSFTQKLLQSRFDLLSSADSVRLQGGTGLCSGRLEVKSDPSNPSNPSWSSVCEADFDQQDAQVVCRQLGCGAPSVLQGALYGEGEAPMGTKEFQCGGHESALLDCSSASERSTCSPGTAVSLTCSEPGGVQLVGGESRCAGDLHVEHQGEWRLVGSRYYDSLWTLKAAEVVCRELDCGSAVSVGWSKESSDRPVWRIRPDCVQSGSALRECAAPYSSLNTLNLTCSDKLFQPNISVSSSMYGVSGAQQQGSQVFRGSTFTISCSIQPQYPGGSFLLSSSTHNYTQPAVNHSAHFLFPAAEPAHQGSYSCVYHVSAFSQDFSSESRLLSVTVTGVPSDPEPFIIRAVVLPLTLLLVTVGLYFYCKATRGRRPSRQEDIELDYDDLGVPAEEEGAQGAE